MARSDAQQLCTIAASYRPRRGVYKGPDCRLPSDRVTLASAGPGSLRPARNREVADGGHSPAAQFECRLIGEILGDLTEDS